jgi:hypothetical protein
MRGGDGQGAAFLVRVLLGDVLDALDLAQNLAGGLEDHLPCGGDVGEVLATAGEDLHAEFILEEADLLADAGLRGIQGLRRGGHVEVVVRDLPDVAQAAAVSWRLPESLPRHL